MKGGGQDDHVIDFTPETGFTIESLAVTIVQMMRDMDMDAHVNLPDGIIIEIEKSCSEQDVIDGYRHFMASHIRGRVPSNRNEPTPVE